MKPQVLRFLFKVGLLAGIFVSADGLRQLGAQETISDADRALLSRLVNILSAESRADRSHDRVRIDVDRDRDRERDRQERSERARQELDQDRRHQQDATDIRRRDPLGFNSRSLTGPDVNTLTTANDFNESSVGALYSTETASTEPLDNPFVRYVDLDQVSIAIRAGDSSFLTDLALQLAEGERVLFRSHKSGVTSRALFEKAIKLALDSKNVETLDRLQRIFEKTDDKELISQLATSRKLGSESRAIEPELTVSFDVTTFEEFHSIKESLNSIREAELLGDRARLQQIESAINASTELSEARKAALVKRIKSALDGIPTSTDGKIDPISRLMSNSRGGLNINTIGGGVLSGKGSYFERPENWGKGPFHPPIKPGKSHFPAIFPTSMRNVTYRASDGTLGAFVKQPNGQWAEFKNNEVFRVFDEIGRSEDRVTLRSVSLYVQLTTNRQALFRSGQGPWYLIAGIQVTSVQ